MGLFNSLHIGTRGLMASQMGMQITGHNISNANTEGYSRQRVQLSSSSVVQKVPGIGVVGTGVDIVTVERVRNIFLDNQITEENSKKGYYDTYSNYLGQVESFLNEPTDVSLNERLDRFWNGWNELSKNPSSTSIRTAVAEEGKALASDINKLYDHFDSLRTDINNDIKVTVDKINNIGKKIADLNQNITRMEINGDKANDYRDERNRLLDELSGLVNITTTDNNDGSINVYIPGYQLVGGKEYSPMKVKIDGSLDKYRDDLYRLTSEKDENIDIKPLQGKLKALFDLRDSELGGVQRKLDYMAITISDNVNEIVQHSFDLDGNKGIRFFKEFNSDSRGIYKIVSGTNLMDVKDVNKPLNDNDNFGQLGIKSGRISLNGKSVFIDADKDSLKDVVNKINSAGAGIRASISPLNQLVLRAEDSKDFKIDALQDATSDFFEKMNILSTGGSYPENSLAQGVELEYTPSEPPAKRLAVQSDVLSYPRKIAIAKGEDTDNDGVYDTAVATSDGTNGLLIANLRDEKLMNQATATVNDYYRSMISTVGFLKERNDMVKDNQTLLVEGLKKKRESQSGVSLDEEMTNMIQFQNSYAANAKYISSVSQMIDTLINRL